MNRVVLFFYFLGFSFSSSILAQTFRGEGGIIIDYADDISPTIFELSVEGLPDTSSSSFGLETICLHIRHAKTRDLKIELLSPSGTLVWLSNRNDDPMHYGYFETCFEQNGFNGSIINGSYRFSGSYHPEGRIEYFNNGQNLNGSWFLIISDLEKGDIGKLLEWSITIGDRPATYDVQFCKDDDLYTCMRDRYNEGHTLLPDLILSRKLTIQNIEYFPDTCSMSPYRNQLRFAAAMANIGDGPLEILGNGDWRCGKQKGNRTEPCPDGSYPRQQVFQRIYSLARDSLLTESKPGGYMYYDTQPGHNHFHADHWVRYLLLKKKWWRKNPKKWKVISTSDKVSYCLYDNMVCTDENMYCTDKEELYSKHNLKNYGFGNFTACNSQQQGISVGGIDYYGKFYEGQFLSIPPDIKCGTYYLLIEIDPENYYQEIDEDNNTEMFKIEIKEDKNGVKYLN